MTTPHRKRLAFRPILSEGALEERVVMDTAAASVARVPALVERNVFLNNLNNSVTGPQFRRAVNRQLRLATRDARTAINAEVASLYANGRPTAQARADFLDASQGILGASAFRVSSMASLLPDGSSRLAPRVQSTFLGGQPRSVATRLARAVNTNATPRALRADIARAFRQANRIQSNAFGRYLNSPTLGFRSVDQTGRTIPLVQFMGNQMISQLGNTIGLISQAFPGMANSVLFANGATEATPEARQAFTSMYTSALGLTAAQLGSGLALLPGLAPGLTAQLQDGLFGTSSLFSGLGGLPSSFDAFNANAATTFSNAFQNLASPLSSAFNLPLSTGSPTFSIPTSGFTGLFDPRFSTLGNGFVNGFGSGIPGFGVASTGLSPNFGRGFTSILAGLNRNTGFRVPVVDGTGSLTGTGNGTGILPGTGLVPGRGSIDGTGTFTGTGGGIGFGGGSISGTGTLTGSGNGTGLGGLGF